MISAAVFGNPDTTVCSSICCCQWLWKFASGHAGNSMQIIVEQTQLVETQLHAVMPAPSLLPAIFMQVDVTCVV